MFSTYSGTEPRYSSGSWFPLTRLQLDGYPLVAGATSAELLPTLDLLAVGAWPSDVYFFNISSVHRSPPPYLQPFFDFEIPRLGGFGNSRKANRGQ